MFLLSLNVNYKEYHKNEYPERIFSKIKPYLKQGSIVLSSNFSDVSSFISPTPIKHCSFCSIEGDKYYITDMTEHGFKKRDILEFLKSKNDVYVFNYIDEKIMAESMNYIEEFRNYNYGFFFSNQYCFKILFSIYNKAYNNKFKKMHEFVPVLNIFNIEFINSNSIMKSKKFIPQCCIINKYFIKFKNS